ncbi:hypothetical protein HYW75_03225 [Candidatus Pacearchaeota archaeon]|nr:hypothetical protein [Candidatus Pacearchaeota archaeon]
MGWKNWPYWLKGGVIGIIFIYLILLLGIFNILNENSFLYILLLPALVVFFYFPYTFNLGGYEWQFITYSIYGLIIGALIGWIYGKIKKKKETNIGR